jgi:hypothetical protein
MARAVSPDPSLVPWYTHLDLIREAVMATRVVRSDEDIIMTEATTSDGKAVINRGYSVRSTKDPTSAQQFGDMGSAEVYFEQLQLRRLNPK